VKKGKDGKGVPCEERTNNYDYKSCLFRSTELFYATKIPIRAPSLRQRFAQLMRVYGAMWPAGSNQFHLKQKYLNLTCVY
jgi:hypothetical protein